MLNGHLTGLLKEIGGLIHSMWLKNVLIFNYKSCNNISIELKKDEPTIFVGINDCGKSSILKAIGLLLDKSAVFHFPSDEKKKNDFSNTKVEENDFHVATRKFELPDIVYSQDRCYIFGSLILEDDDINQDIYQNFSSHIQWVLDNRDDDQIWILRVFDKIDSSNKYYLLTKDTIINDEIGTLYNQPANYLKSLATELNVNVTNENGSGRFKNSEYVESIYNSLELSNKWVEYKKPDYKYFPEYRYLDWNITMEELKSVAEQAIKTKIETNINAVKTLASQSAQTAQNIVDVELEQFTERFAGDFPNIKGFKSNIIFDVSAKLTDILINKENTDSDIHLDSQGEGVKRQIWFALIKWTALNSLENDTQCKKFIWCFDEPETHLYPKAQRELFEIIKEVSVKNIQNIISTHSTIFIDRSKFETIRRFELSRGYTKTFSCVSEYEIYDTLEIRNSDFLFYDKFLVVEGETEESLLPHFYKLYCNDTFHAQGVQLICLGGKSKRKQNFHILRQLLHGFNKSEENIIYMFDNDIIYDNDFTAHEISEITHILIGKQDIEDSISSDVWVDLVNTEFKSLGFEINIETIEELKNNLQGEKVDANQKFYAALRRKIKTTIGDPDRYQDVDDLLPSKSKTWGTLLSKYIKTRDNIPEKIIEAFDSL